MIININEKHRIRTGNDQFILEVRAEEKPDKPRQGDGWRPIGYASRIHELWNLLFHRQIMALEGEYPFDALSALTDALETITGDIKAGIKAANQADTSNG